MRHYKLLHPICAVLCSLALCGPARPGLAVANAAAATVCTWLGGSGAWTAATNWSCGAIPTASDDVVIGALADVQLPAGALAQARNVTLMNAVLRGAGDLRARVVVLETSGVSMSGLYVSGQVTIAERLQLTGESTAQIGESSVPTLILADRAQLGVGTDSASAILTVTQFLTITGGSLSGAHYNFGARQSEIHLASSATALYQASGPVGGQVSRLKNFGTLTVLSGDQRASLLQLTNYGRLNMTSAASMPLAVQQLVNLGDARIAGAFEASDSYFWDQTDGAMTISATLPGLAIRVYGGTLAGRGELRVIDQYAGTVSPGLPVGALSVDQYIANDDAGPLLARVGGDRPMLDYGVLRVNTLVRAPAVLEIESRNGFMPRIDQTFSVLTYTNGLPGERAIPVLLSTQPVWSAFTAQTADGALRVTDGIRNPIAALAARFSAPIRLGDVVAGDAIDIQLTNKAQTPSTLRAITITLPLSATYLAGSVSGVTTSAPTITSIGGRQRLEWALSVPLAAGATATQSVRFGLSAAPEVVLQIADVAAQVSVGVSVQVLRASPTQIRARAPSPDTVIVPTAGRMSTTDGLPLLALDRANTAKPILIRAHPRCPAGESCGVLVKVSVNALGVDYAMTPGAPPTLPLGSLASIQQAVPEWHHWIPGLSCAQQLPDFYCKPANGPCSYPIYLDTTYASGRYLRDLLFCGALYDPSGIVRNAITKQPIANATVTLQRVPNGLPDFDGQTNQCRTTETRPGGAWTGVPAGAGGRIEDPFSAPASMSPALNPQQTNAEGRYGWDVTAGCWYVTVSARGYASVTSPLVGVPPAVTDLDIELQPNGERSVYLPGVRR
jgi:hypothetical protein